MRQFKSAHGYGISGKTIPDPSQIGPGVSRKLTEGELSYAKGIFGASLNYEKVRIHDRPYIFQPSNFAMTPNGEVYFPPTLYKKDFSKNISDAAWLIHELTHAWQHQKGISVIFAVNRKYEYGNLAESNQNFLDYGIEQQASIVKDYFLIKNHKNPEKGNGSMSDYQRIIPFAPKANK